MNRISHIASLLKGYYSVVDIGTDHGLVLKEALDLGYIKTAIAADLNEKPLLAAKKNLVGYPVQFVLSNGFISVSSKFDCAIITGMGSYLIIDIMKNAPTDVKVEYILGANDKVFQLREWLVNNGFMITDETVIFDGFYYQFLKVKRGSMVLSEKELHLGVYLPLKDEAKNYYLHQANYYHNLANKVPDYDKKRYQQLADWFKIAGSKE